MGSAIGHQNIESEVEPLVDVLARQSQGIDALGALVDGSANTVFDSQRNMPVRLFTKVHVCDA